MLHEEYRDDRQAVLAARDADPTLIARLRESASVAAQLPAEHLGAPGTENDAPPDRPARVYPGNSEATKKGLPVTDTTPPRRYTWAELPPSLQAAVIRAVGDVHAVETPPDPWTSSFAAVLTTDRTRVFVKAANRVDNPKSAESHKHEVAVARMVSQIPTAHLLDALDVDTWSALVYQAVDGRPANYAPGSSDLTLLATAMRTINSTRFDLDLDLDLDLDPTERLLPTLGQRLAGHLDDAGRALLHGSTLLHHDLSPANVSVVDEVRVVFLDFGCATIGPAWVDGAGLYMWLRQAGHSAAAAHRWVLESCPSWPATSLAARRAFLRAVRAENLRPAAEFDMWTELLDPTETAPRGRA
ncbi:phosphotransferase [Embleya sp. AB8]|uniref:phosphotransferase n=1 Tax=Embleya sp. AB8 TaxID=3156304 RepID=UPI003C7251E7